MSRMNIRRALSLAAFPLLLVALFVPVLIWREEIWWLFSSAQRLREWVSGWGIWAPLVFLGVQAIQVIVFVIPGEVPQIAAGFLFGIWLGGLLSIAGILAGSAASFFLARGLGVPFVKSLFPPDQVEKIAKLLETRRAKIVFFLLFLIPGIPKDILCYVAGLSPMRFVFFAGASTLGRLPGIIGSVIIGEAAAGSRWWLAGGLFLGAAILFGAGLLFRPRLQAWLERLSRGRRS